MDDILASVNLEGGRTVHIAQLARETILDSGAEHMGYQGYFLFEANDAPGVGGISILGKAVSYDAAMRLIDVFGMA